VAQISFNYLGRFDAPVEAGQVDEAAFAISDGPRGVERAPANERTCLFEVTSAIGGGEMQVEWTYSRALHRRETVEHVGELFLSRLRSFIAPEAAGLDMSGVSERIEDFGWDDTDLDAIMKAIQPADPKE
jgi:non-ribosomal peptide synthase protein (TIGR01720 family)